jgi:hypothetical protein
MPLWLLAAWALLAAIQLGWLPFARHAWAFNLWAYLPGWAAWLLGAASLLLCAPRVRETVAAGFAAAARRLPRGAAAEAAAAFAATALFWALRERANTGDSGVLAAAAHAGHAFVFPEVGATFLLRWLFELGRELGLRPVEAMRLLPCASGGIAVFLMLRVAREIAPGWPAAAVALFALSGGLARVFAGRIEVYAPLLVAILAYLWTALRAARGAGRGAAAALWLGVAIWLHAAAILLLPSLLLLPGLRRPGGPLAPSVREGAALAALAAAPLALFLALQAAGAGASLLAPLLARVREILGRSEQPGAVRWWVRGWGGAPSIGTDVVLLGRAHLKYLLNAFALLVPAALPVLAVVLARRPRALLAGREGRLLAAAALPLALYALALRPFWGPWDWDLFSATALVLACLALRLAFEAAPPRASSLAVACIGFQLLFFGIPFLWIGAKSEVREAGPFGFRGFDYELRRPGTPAPERLAPWL